MPGSVPDSKQAPQSAPISAKEHQGRPISDDGFQDPRRRHPALMRNAGSSSEPRLRVTSPAFDRPARRPARK